MTDQQKLTFEYSGIPVRYIKKGSGPPLLILHGWGSRADVMLPLAEKLSDLRTCYIPDLPGFGETTAPSNSWNVDDYTDFAEKFADDIIGERFELLAHSFGGRMALKWCARTSSRDKIGRILITGGAGMKPRRTYSYYRRRVISAVLKAPFLLLPDALKNKSLDWLRNTDLWKSLGSSDYQKLEGVMRETFVKTVSEHLESCLSQIKHEILLLWGKDDATTPWYQAERMAKGLVNGALVGIDSAGHYAFLDQPTQFCQIARAYFENKN